MIPILPQKTCCHLQTCAGEEAGGETLLTLQIIWTELNEINLIQYTSTNKILYYAFIGYLV